MSLPEKPTKTGSQEESRATVLVVDDTPENIMLLDEILKADYRVRAATRGEQALKIANADKPPDIVLLDVMMPGMDGFEVCRRLKHEEKTRFIPVVMVTALSGLEDRIQALDAGADDFLTKPVEPAEVRARVRSLLRMKRLHDALQDSNDQLKQAQELRENLTNMIVHDLRTPLTGVIGSLWSMSGFEEFKPGSDLLEFHQMAVTNSEKLLGMINDLLDITKMESGQMTVNAAPVALAEVAAEAQRAVSPLAQMQELTLNVQIPPDVPLLSADRELLRRVLVNLAGNAIKFTPSGGSVTIGARPAEGGFVRINVTDTGYGIPPGYHEKIFEKFGQVEGRAENKKLSTGLGLTFCKMAVEAHGGQIGVESQEGQGSTFYFTLPTDPGVGC